MEVGAEVAEAEAAEGNPRATMGEAEAEVTTGAEVKTEVGATTATAVEGADSAEAEAEMAEAEAEAAGAETAADGVIATARAEVTRCFSWHTQPPNGLLVHLVCL